MTESLYQTIIDSAGDAVITVDPVTNRVLYVNHWGRKLTGLSSGDVLSPAPACGSIGFPSLGWLYHIVREADRRKVSRTCVISQPPDHSRRNSRYLEVFATRMDKGVSPVAVLVRTLNSDKLIESKLWQRNRELLLLNRANCVIGRTLDPDEVLTLALDFALDFFGARMGIAFRPEPAEGLIRPTVAKGLPEAITPEPLMLEDGHGAVKSFLSGVPIFSTAACDRDRFPQQSTASTASIPLQNGEQVLGVLEIAATEAHPTNYDPDLLTSFGFQVGIALDNALLHRKIETASQIDGLTGAFTRTRLESILEESLRRGTRYGETFATLMVDIDRFKAINDVYGHDVGDRVLVAVVEELRRDIRDSDFLGRWGGEEFVIILAQTGWEAAVTIAERIRLSVAAKDFEGIAGVELPVTVCVGISCFPTHAQTGEGLVRCADEAMRHAKKTGRNRTQFYNTKMGKSHVRTLRQHIILDESAHIIRALAAALDAKDSYTANHSEAVRHLAVRIARQMPAEDSRIEVLEWAALLHDIGKVAVPDSILNKPGRLSDEEWEIIKQHPRMGVLILKEVPQLYPIIPLVLHHHENYDGSGYPEGRSMEKIPMPARILRVADAFMAMTSTRPYRKALSPEKTLSQIDAGRGTLFDPAVVDALKEVASRGLDKKVP